MKPPVDLYESHYAQPEAPVHQAVRRGAFGDDLGQTSWITAGECDDGSRALALGAGRRLLEVACGTGGVALRLAETSGASVVGVDLHEAAISAATRRATRSTAAGRAEFRVADANDALPFPDASFDALFCNDAINHFRDRPRVLADWHRVLRPGGRCLYTDPIVVTGCLSAAALIAIEGETRFEEFQRFLAMVHALASERRLARFRYVGVNEPRTG
jgi:SAM-dependent methyltransferase